MTVSCLWVYDTPAHSDENLCRVPGLEMFGVVFYNGDDTFWNLEGLLEQICHTFENKQVALRRVYQISDVTGLLSLCFDTLQLPRAMHDILSNFKLADYLHRTLAFA